MNKLVWATITDDKLNFIALGQNRPMKCHKKNRFFFLAEDVGEIANRVEFENKRSTAKIEHLTNAHTRSLPKASKPAVKQCFSRTLSQNSTLCTFDSILVPTLSEVISPITRRCSEIIVASEHQKFPGWRAR